MVRKTGYFRTLAAAAFGRLAVKASVFGPMIARLMLGRPVWPERQYERLAKEGYQQNPVVYACIALIAKSVCDIPYVLKDGNGDEIEEHPFLDLMQNPNPEQDRTALLTAFVTQRLFSGNGYLERTDEKTFERMELYAHRADRMRVVPGEMGTPMAYEYNVGGATRRIEVDLESGTRPILHLKSYNPLHDWYGQSPLDPCAWAIDLYNGGSAYNKAIQDNAGAPSGALVFEGSETHGTTLSPEAYEATLRQLRGQERGFDRGGDKMLLEGGKHSWLQFGLDPEKMQFVEGMNRAAREIAFTLGVPPELVGLPGDKTYSNYAEARLSFYQETVIPLSREIASALNRWFARQLGKGVTIEVDLDNVEALQVTRDLLWARIEKSTTLSLNEKRAALGYDDVDGGDEHYVSAGQLPLSAAAVIDTETGEEITPPGKKPSAKKGTRWVEHHPVDEHGRLN
jgi:HK97 family phage portal protein